MKRPVQSLQNKCLDLSLQVAIRAQYNKIYIFREITFKAQIDCNKHGTHDFSQI